MYLSGRQTPNFRTIRRFKKQRMTDTRNIFHRIVAISAGLDMVALEDVFSDGCEIETNALVKHSKTKERKIEKTTI